MHAHGRIQRELHGHFRTTTRTWEIEKLVMFALMVCTPQVQPPEQDSVALPMPEYEATARGTTQGGMQGNRVVLIIGQFTSECERG